MHKYQHFDDAMRLHLLGMDHQADRGAMARAEKRWRQTFHLPVGLIERSRAKKAK